MIATLMGGEQAAMFITDPPFNVPINGHVSGKSRIRHAEFAMGSGEMTADEFISFLKRFLAAALTRTAPGALLYVATGEAFEEVAEPREEETNSSQCATKDAICGEIGDHFDEAPRLEEAGDALQR
jgi:hypothetical protein